MPKIKYQDFNFSPETRAVIDQANAIIAEYESAGYALTLRQLYYQFVSRALIPNTERSYKRLGSIVNDGRMAGLIDWLHIQDRGRFVRGNSHWRNPAQIVAGCAAQFQIDKWADQKYRIEVWIEKDALLGVIEEVCRRLDVSYFSCRGYTSQSEMWGGAQRLVDLCRQHGQTPVILHFGDHDPSGIDMSRDITDRMQTFMGGVTFDRLALNMDQVREYQPPPNPAKVTDSRYEGYRRLHGDESWELDALEPRVLASLVERHVVHYRELRKWKAKVAKEEEYRATLKFAADNWAMVEELQHD
jgi:hypothetical protein